MGSADDDALGKVVGIADVATVGSADDDAVGIDGHARTANDGYADKIRVMREANDCIWH